MERLKKSAPPSLLSNLAWFIGSFALALMVWVVAAIQADPIRQQSFNNIPVILNIPEGFTLTSTPRQTARVIVRAQQSVLSLLSAEDIVVRAEIPQRVDGTYTIPLAVTVNRNGVIAADTQPTQLSISLATIATEQKPIELLITEAPPVDYTYDPPTSNILQVEVRGAVQAVQNVAEVRGEIELGDIRNPYNADVTLFAVDSEGKRVPETTIEPRAVRVTVNVYPRDDVRQVSVRPNIQLETLLPDYVLSSISYEPQSVFISGAKSELANVGATIDTAPISLAGQTSTFTAQTTLILPSNLLIIGDSNSITVTIGISALTTVRQIDNIPVEVIGQPSSYSLSLSPTTLSVVLSGPIAIVNTLTPQDIQAIIDVNNIRAGTHELTPRLLVRKGEVTLDSASALPSVVTITLVAPAEETTTPP